MTYIEIFLDEIEGDEGFFLVLEGLLDCVALLSADIFLSPVRDQVQIPLDLGIDGTGNGLERGTRGRGRGTGRGRFRQLGKRILKINLAGLGCALIYFIGFIGVFFFKEIVTKMLKLIQ